MTTLPPVCHPVLHIDLRSISDTQATLYYGWENLNRANSRSLPLTDIDDLVSSMERDYYALLPEDLALTGKLLYRWLDGTDHWLERTLRERPRERLIALAIAAAGNLAHLPWEVLHDGTEFLVERHRPTLVPMRWCYGNPDDPLPLAPDDPTSVKNRALNLLFMATAPEEVDPKLDFEQEEARILNATRKHLCFLQVEESGCLEELEDLVAICPEDFDIVHLTGHADHTEAGSVFLTETAVGSRYDASAEEIAGVFRYRFPRLLFLSGCRTGERIQRGNVLSLAEDLIRKGGPDAVLGWGRSVLDKDSTEAASALYGELAAGKTLLEAMALTFQTLLKIEAEDWHLLRLYVTNVLPGAFVTRSLTPGREKPPQHSITRVFLDPEKNVKVASRDSFVGRRRPLQRCLKVLRDPTVEKLGIVIIGMGGYGKSSLAARLCDRLPEFHRLVLIGQINEPVLTGKLANWLDDANLRQAITNTQELLIYRLRNLFCTLARRSSKPLLLVLDDFEQNFEADCESIKTPAIECLIALIDAIKESETSHRLLITCRYRLSFSQAKQLFHQPIAKFKDADWQKKYSQLPTFQSTSQVPQEQQKRALTLADGNPRLAEWLDKLFRGEDKLKSWNLRASSEKFSGVDIEAILAELDKAKNEELLERVLAATLLTQMNEPMQEMLQRGRVFELPVPLTVLREICEDVRDLDSSIERALALGLLETDIPEPNPNNSPNLPVRVPKVLPLKVSEDESLAARAAQAFYRWLGERGTQEVRKTETQQEIHRLALKGKKKELAVELCDKLATEMLNNFRFEETLTVAGKTLTLLKELKTPFHRFDITRIRHYLAYSYHKLGKSKEAEESYQKISERYRHPFKKTQEEQQLQADFLYNYAEYLKRKNQDNLPVSINYLEESLNINQALGRLKEEAEVLTQIGICKQNQGQYHEAMEFYKRSMTIAENINNSRIKSDNLYFQAMAKSSLGENEKAIQLTKKALRINDDIKDLFRRSNCLFQLGKLYTNKGQYDKGQYDEAERLFQECLGIREDLGLSTKRAPVLLQWGKVKRFREDFKEAWDFIEEAFLLNLRYDKNDKLANLKQLLKIARDLARNGSHLDAKVSLQKLVELSIKANYSYAVAWARVEEAVISFCQENDKDQALQKIYQAREILRRIDSRDVSAIEDIISRIEANDGTFCS